MRTYYLAFTILFSTVCLNILVLSQDNDKISESESKSSTLDVDGEKKDSQEKAPVAVDPGGLPREKYDNPPTEEHQKSPIESENTVKDTKPTEIIEPEKDEKIQTDQLDKEIKDNDQSPPLSQPVKEPESDQSKEKKVAIETTEEKSGVTDSTTGLKESEKYQQVNEASTPESLKATEKSTETVDSKSTDNDIKTSELDTAPSSTEEPKQQYPKQPGGHSTTEPKHELTNDTEELDKTKQMDVPLDEKLADKDDSELETFSEYWTKSIMEEEEKSKQSGDKPGPSSSVNKQTKRKQHNYASRECGAKILANNPEAENVRSILNSNKDDYMINPCKARKWFVIELCEPVQLSSVEIASYELFSSQPKHFYVGFSDRYPTKEWKTYGFNTKDERALQSFTIPEEDVYYKYVKVEITDHYGEEHFCPLTLFKVYGIAVEYDDDDNNVPSEDDNDLDQAVLLTGDENADHQSPKNLFSSAKDTVVKIIKRVLNVEEEKEVMNGTDTRNMTDKQINETLKLNMSKDGFMLPCVPEVGKPDIAPTDPGPTNGKIQPNPPYHYTSTLPKDAKDPQQTGSNDNKIHVNLPEPSATIVRKLEDHEQVPSEEKAEALVTLLESETDTGNLHQKISNCLGKNENTNKTADKNKTKKSSNTTADLCAYVQIMMLNKVIHTCASKMVKATRSGMTESSFILIDKTVTKETKYSTSSVSVSEDTRQKQMEKITSQSDTGHTTAKVSEPTTHILVKETITSDTVPVESLTSTETDKKSFRPKVDLSTSTVSMETQTKQEEIVSSPSSVFVTIESSVITKATDEFQKPAESLTTSTDSSIQDQVTLEPSITSSSVVVDTPQDITPVLQGTTESYRLSTEKEEAASITKQTQTAEQVTDKVQVVEQKTVSVPQSSVDKTLTTSIEPTPSLEQKSELQFTDPPTQQGHTEQMSTQQPIREQAEPVQEKKMNDTVDQEPSKPDTPKQRDLGLVRVPIMPFQKRDPIMRLSNRIKALELNVSLSSRFLDKMSQKFKRQSEDLMKTLNKTIGRFENATREAEIREKKQKNQISVLEAQIENLTSIVVRLTQKMDTIDKEVTDRQMVWTSVEVIILIIIFLICLRRGKSTPAHIPPEIQRLLETMPRQPDLSLNPRRNSFSAIEDKPGITTVGPTLQKYQSETTLVASTDTLDNTQIKFDPGGNTGVNHQYKQVEYGKEVMKKKKKKKKSHDGNKTHVCESSESLTDINSAGLLFSAGGITPDSINCDTIKRSSSHGLLSRLFWGKDKSNENSKKVTIGPTTVAVGKPPKNTPHSTSTGNIRNKRHSVDESGGSKAKKNGCISQSQSYPNGVQEIQKGKYLPNGNSSKFNDSKGQPHPYKGPMLNGKVTKHGQTRHVRGKSADFTPTDHDKSSGLWMNLIGRK